MQVCRCAGVQVCRWYTRVGRPEQLTDCTGTQGYITDHRLIYLYPNIPKQQIIPYTTVHKLKYISLYTQMMQTWMKNKYKLSILDY